MEDIRLKRIIEAALMAADTALNVDRLLQLFELDEARPTRGQIKSVITQLQQECEGRGIELKRVASGYRYQTRNDVQPWVSRLWQEKPPRYSRALLETLALIVYRQPVTRGEIEHVRGVSVSSNIIRTLLEREWIRVIGYKEVPGRPALYGSTKQFLDHFNLKSLDELPDLMELTEQQQTHPELNLEGPQENKKDRLPIVNEDKEPVEANEKLH